MMSSISAELLKLRKRPAVWLLVGVWLTLNMSFGYVAPYISYRTGSAQDGVPPEQLLADLLPINLVSNVLDGYPVFGGALVLVLGALITGGEYGLGTMKTILTQRPRRLSVLGGMLAALAVTVIAIGLTSFAFSAGASLLIAVTESASTTLPSASEVITGLGAGWLILGMWGLMGLLAGLAFRGTSLAIGLGLVWALVVENLIRATSSLLDVFDTVQRALPGVNAGSLAAAIRGDTPGQAAPGVEAVVGGGQAVLVLGIYAVVFVLAAAALLRQRDVA